MSRRKLFENRAIYCAPRPFRARLSRGQRNGNAALINPANISGRAEYPLSIVVLVINWCNHATRLMRWNVIAFPSLNAAAGWSHVGIRGIDTDKWDHGGGYHEASPPCNESWWRVSSCAIRLSLCFSSCRGVNRGTKLRKKFLRITCDRANIWRSDRRNLRGYSKRRVWRGSWEQVEVQTFSKVVSWS